MAQRIDTVVFDIGNVLIQWDPRHLYRRVFSEPERIEWFLTHVCSPEWNHRQDAGRSWGEAEAELIKRFPGLADEIRAYRARWHEMVPGPVAGMVDVFDAIGRLGLRRLAISNFAADTFLEAAERFPMLAAFDGAAISGRLGITKPEPAIYRWLIDGYGVDPNRALFVDDLAVNVEGARAVGLAAVQFHDAPTLVADLARLGVALDVDSRDAA